VIENDGFLKCSVYLNIRDWFGDMIFIECMFLSVNI
jgi:hypothetical protein